MKRVVAASVVGLILIGAFGALAAEPTRPGVDLLRIDGPMAGEFPVLAATELPLRVSPPLDRFQALAEDEVREWEGLPPRFALAEDVRITPETDGVWENLGDDFVLWRLHLIAPGALSMNLGFGDFRLPKNSRLSVYPSDARGIDDVRGVRVFNEWDNTADSELWTPIVVADDIVVELLLPVASRRDYELTLTSINRGYRVFGLDPTASTVDKSGTCNIDVVCPEGDDWRAEIASVGVYTINGTWFCTGSVINNTAQDQRPLFLTAYHCGVTTSTDQGVVVYWNFESPTCGQQGGGSLADFNSGVVYLASSSTSDFTLVEFEEPLNPDHNVSYAGWDRSGADVASAVAIHHPSTDEKSISFEYDATTITSYLQNPVPGDGTHIRVTDWDLGTTEGGSSGSPLFDPNHHVIGQLHGGYAACNNDLSDWYGRLSVSWSGLSPYLDPLETGAVTLDTYAPWQSGMAVSAGSFDTEGDAGGPFIPTSKTYTVTNQGASTINVAAAANVAWLDVAGGGSVAPGGQILVMVSVNSATEVLTNGSYAGVVSFTNLSTGEGDATRDANVTVGLPAQIYSYPLDANPGWTADTGWEFGVPLGAGGDDHGNPDPSAGYTGSQVYGYNLAGDYTADLPERHLTTTAIDCSSFGAVSLRFQRWLNVEQSLYDHAYVRVSNDGSNWTTVWTNGGVVEDNAWTPVEYDISAVADGQPTVYVRWTMGITDETWEYSGWNFDDVEIWGVHDGISAVNDLPEQRLAVGNHPNPFNPLTKVSFVLEQDGRASLNVYDLQGRLVRSLVDDALSAGPHAVVWDGLDETGRKVGSGVYLARLVAGNKAVEHKMIMLK